MEGWMSESLFKRELNHFCENREESETENNFWTNPREKYFDNNSFASELSSPQVWLAQAIN
jgi:hypothetical protein